MHIAAIGSKVYVFEKQSDYIKASTIYNRCSSQQEFEKKMNNTCITYYPYEVEEQLYESVFSMGAQ